MSSIVVRALLRLYPRVFRERYSREIIAFHEDRARHGIRMRSWPRIIADHLTSALSEHLRLAKAEQFSPTGGTNMGTITQDLRYALRALSRRGVFTVVVIATIALGVGANTAIFSVVHAILLRPLPYPHPERVVSFGHLEPTWLTSDPEYLDYKRELRSFESLAAFTQGEGNLSTEEEPERVTIAQVTPNFFDVLGVAPEIGRGFAADEDLVAPSPIVIISHNLWRRRFDGDLAVVGKTLNFNGRPRTVIGVMPRNFDYPAERTDIWLPMRRFQPDGNNQRANHYLFAVGRLKPSVTVENASAEAVTYAKRMVQENISNYDPNSPPIPTIAQVTEKLVGSTRPYLWALLGAVGFVLLIVCANVANLLLARGEGRRKEMAVRNALGASRGRLITQLLSEAIVLAVVGGALGLLFAWSVLRALIASAPSSIPRLDEIGIDWIVLGYAFVISLATGLLFGLVPAIRAAREAPADSLKKGGRTELAGSRRVRQSLVVAEVALAVVMLSGAGMLLRSLINLQRMDTGFNLDSTLTVKVSPGGYDDGRAIVFYSQLLERVRAIPGVEHVGAASWLPVVQTGGLWGLAAEGQSYDNVPQAPLAAPQQVTPGYFHAMGIPILSGRDFNDQDRAEGPYVGIVSQKLAQNVWPNQNALGKRIRLGGGETFVTVVGVVGDIRSRGFTDTPEPTMYFAYPQTARAAYFLPRSMSLVIRTKGNPMLIAGQVRSIVRSLDATVPVSDIRTLEDVFGTAVSSRRFSTTLIAAFATLALVLAGIGIFGVISYGVSERTFEIGVRMALGSEKRGALALVLNDSLRMGVLGIALGLAGAAAVARAIRSLLFNVSPVDWPTLLGVSVLLISVVVLATILPARRAMAVSPTEALRG
jgi:putative ABC transport system permease protein